MSGEEQDPVQALRVAAMNALARREHARAELERKLQGKPDASPELVTRVLDRLAEQGLQCDGRFAEAFCRSRYQRGYGPVRIAGELRQRGVSEQYIERGLAELEADWFELARSVAARRFGEVAPEDYKEKARRMRFLQYRGFDQEQIRHALEQ